MARMAVPRGMATQTEAAMGTDGKRVSDAQNGVAIGVADRTFDRHSLAATGAVASEPASEKTTIAKGNCAVLHRAALIGRRIKKLGNKDSNLD